jgi:acyl carrier protein
VKGEGGESELRGRVRQVVETIAPIQGIPVKPESRFLEDLGYDSLGLVELVLALEGELGLPEIDGELGWMEIERVSEVEELVVAALAGGGLPVAR